MTHAHNTTHPIFADWTTFSTADKSASYIFQSDARGVLIAHVLCMLAAALLLLPLVLFPPASKRLPSRWPARFLRPALHISLCLSLIIGVAFASIHRQATEDLYQHALHRTFGFALVLYVLITSSLSLVPQVKALLDKQAPVDADFVPLSQFDDTQAGDVSPTGSFASGQSQETLPCFESDGPQGDCHAAATYTTLRQRAAKLVGILHKVFLVATFYAQILLGLATLGGLFRGHEIYNGLAHWIKASVFFIFGLWVFLRYLGITASSGMAWNAPHNGTRLLTAEQIECGLIFTYGVLNLFLERLGHMKEPISHTDIQHMSIALLYACAGGVGLLLESQLLRRLTLSPHSSRDTRRPVLNIMPLLVTFFTGLLMSQHHQDTELASTVHAIWGYFFCIASVFRLLTYLSIFARPDIMQDTTPSRPPTEALVAFSLVAGALVFMASSRDVVQSIEYYDVHTFFVVSLAAAASLCVIVWTCFLAVIMHLST